MSKLSKKNEALEREENAALTAEIGALTGKMEAYQNAFDKSFAEIESIKDHAKKIVELRGLDSRIYSAARAIDRERDNIVMEQRKLGSIRGDRSVKSRRKRIWNRILAVPTIGFTTIVVDQYSHKSRSEEKQKLRELIDGAFEQVGIDAFRKTSANKRARITTMLDEAVKDCDLGKISKSLHFPDALEHEPLKKKFQAAAMARAALGEDDDQPKDTTAESPTKLRSQQSPLLRL